MLVLDTPDSMRAWADARRADGRRIGLVPTMGALHEGHLELVRVARDEADVVVVSIFVNPLQFNEASDFQTYPRPIDDDLATCRELGVDAVYAPTAAAMYPPGFETHVQPGALADSLEGPMRPGHFRGVATVVTKLFGATRPDVAVFGRKDFQQLRIVTRMAADLDLGVRIVGVPTVREPDGLALSSRNTRLSPDDRRAAVVLSSALRRAAEAYAAGERRAEELERIAGATIDAEPRASREYVRLVDAATLSDVGDVDEIDGHAVLLTAVWFGDVRLIDNVELGRDDG